MLQSTYTNIQIFDALIWSVVNLTDVECAYIYIYMRVCVNARQLPMMILFYLNDSKNNHSHFPLVAVSLREWIIITERERHFCVCQCVRSYIGGWSKLSPQQLTRRTRAHQASNIHPVLWKIGCQKLRCGGFSVWVALPNARPSTLQSWFPASDFSLCRFCLVLFFFEGSGGSVSSRF